MRQHLVRVKVPTRGRSLVDVTHEIRAAVRASGLQEGLVTVFVRHTSASVIIQENADPDVLGDMLRFFARLVPDGDPSYRHDAEGPDDMPAHVRAALTATQLAVPFSGGALLLGTWQAVYLFEHRSHPHTRELVLHVLGE
ncbi:MAG: YjbQ family protein [Myxococcales bacterium]|nr:YjbQ family protein [Myxococcales bacterium]